MPEIPPDCDVWFLLFLLSVLKSFYFSFLVQRCGPSTYKQLSGQAVPRRQVPLSRVFLTNHEIKSSVIMSYNREAGGVAPVVMKQF